MFHVPNEYRIRTDIHHGTNDSIGNYGMFCFTYKGYDVKCIASEGEGWEHVSVSINRKRTPDWDIMCHVKDLFWDKEDTVIQYHPPESKYVNTHPYVLHLWRPIGIEIPVPSEHLVGVKGLTLKNP